MAKRPVFTTIEGNHQVDRWEVDFVYAPGFAIVQKQKCIRNLHEAFRKRRPMAKVLEISSKSEVPLGVQLSAFNLTLMTKNGTVYTVESFFQGCKVFQNGGPYKDLWGKTSREAKRDERLKKSGPLVAFSYNDLTFPLEPKTFFYNWIYINALHSHPELEEQIVAYDAFTDIEFNPAKSINCQAEAAAIFVSLYRKGLLEEALQSKQRFLELVYGYKCEVSQTKLF